LQERAVLQRTVDLWKDLHHASEDIQAMIELLEEEDDDSLAAEIEPEIQALSKKIEQAEIKAMLSGPSDFNGAILTVNSGAGGTESQDWAEILQRMYLRWGDRNGYKAEILDTQYGEEAGIKNCTIIFKGDFAYGYLKAEIGIHRLVRISKGDTLPLHRFLFTLRSKKRSKSKSKKMI